MSTPVTFNGVTYNVPANAETNWGTEVSNFLLALGTFSQTTVAQVQAARVVTTTPANLTTTDYAVYVNVLTPASVVLPSAAVGQVVVVKDASGAALTNNITITPAVGQTIDAASSYTLSDNGAGVVLQFRGNNSWQAIAAIGNPSPTYGTITVSGTLKLSGQTPGLPLKLDSSGNVVAQAGSSNALLGYTAAGTDTEAKQLVGTASQIVVTQGPGSLTLSAPQNLSSSDSPTFAGIAVGSASGPARLSSGVLATGATDLSSSDVSGVLPSTKGGTGVNNPGTLTIGSSNVTLTTAGVTSLTVPTSGTVATLAGTEVLTNKDIDGGTAAVTNRITLPKNTTAALNALARKQGTLVFDTNTNELKVDNGTSLIALGVSTGSVTGSGTNATVAVWNGGSTLTNSAVTTTELGYVAGVTSGIQSQIATNATAIASKEPAVTAGTSAQYYRGDKSFQTLNQAAVAGLTTTDSVTHNAVTATTSVTAASASVTGSVSAGSVSATGSLTGGSLLIGGTAGAGFAQMQQQSANPTTPASGKNLIYVKADDKIYRATNAGYFEALSVEGSAQNYLINGGMDFAQRRPGATPGAYMAYVVDRFTGDNGQTGIYARQTFAPSGAHPGNANYQLLVLGDGATSMNLTVSQGLDNESTAKVRGRVVTLSGFVYFSAATTSSSGALGAWNAAVGYRTGTPDAAFSSTNYLAAGSASVGFAQGSLPTAYRFFSITYAVPAGAINLGVRFGFNNAAVAAAGDYYALSNLMLNIGSVPAPFQLAGGSIGNEYLLAQRYYQKSYRPTDNNTVGNAAGGQFYPAGSVAQNAVVGAVQFAVAMRRVPDVNCYSYANAYLNAVSANNGSDYGFNSGTPILMTEKNFQIQNLAALTLTPSQGGYQSHWTANAEL